MFARIAAMARRFKTTAAVIVGLSALASAPAVAATWDYAFAGTVTSTFARHTSLPAGVAPGVPFSGTFSILDTVSGYESSSSGYSSLYPYKQMTYPNAVVNMNVTVGSNTYTPSNFLVPNFTIPSSAYLVPEKWASVSNNTPDIAQYRPEDVFVAGVAARWDGWWPDGSGGQFYLSGQARGMGLYLASSNTSTFTSPTLSGLVLQLPAFDKKAEFSWFETDPIPDAFAHFWDGDVDLSSERRFAGTVTSLVRQVTGSAISSGSVSVAAGTRLVIPSASGGQINAQSASVSIGNLSGGVVQTGSAGATVTTLTSGSIATAGAGRITTEGGSFTGHITGNGGITMTGTGTLLMNSSNSYTGDTVINAGTVQIAVGDALGTGAAPIRIANNGRFKAVEGVAVTKTVILSSTSAVYEHVLSGSDSITNLATISNTLAKADVVAGDSVATTFAANFNGNGSVSLHGLNNTNFLMVFDIRSQIPNNATPSDYYLGWWNAAANGGTGSWVNAVLGNHGANGEYAGAYTESYQKFLTDHGGWNGAKMLGAYGLDVANSQVWAVIDHNSEFGMINGGILMVPEPSATVMAFGGALLGLGYRCRRRFGGKG